MSIVNTPLLSAENGNAKSFNKMIWNEQCLTPTSKITSEQWTWIILHSITTAMVCFGVNFAICTLSFYGKEDPTLWEFPTPVAACYGLTVLIELSLNWFINGYVMSTEIKKGKIAPLDPSCLPWWPTNSPSILWYFDISELAVPQRQDAPKKSLLWKAVCHEIRVLPWMVFTGLTLLPIFVLVTWVLYGNDNYNAFPQPELLVSVFGALLALMTIPFWAIIALANMGSRILDD